MVRTNRDGGDKEQWLVFHKKDEHAVAGWDTEKYPQSVRSGRTNDEVAAHPDALWRSDAPAATAEHRLLLDPCRHRRARRARRRTATGSSTA